MAGRVRVAYLPVSRPPPEWAVGDYAQPLGLCEGQDLDLGLSANQVVHRLDQLEAGQGFPRLDPEGGRDLPGRPVADRGVEDLALPDEVVERTEGLLDRGVVVEGVDEVEVEAVRAEAAQAGFCRAHDVTAAGQTSIVGSIASREEDL